MANEEHLAILKKGVEVWNAWRKENPGIHPDLSRADLVMADLKEARLYAVDLSEARLDGADLVSANLSGANLALAKLDGAKLTNAHLEQAHLERAHLMGAELTGASLSHAYLYGADLSGARLARADLTAARLTGASLAGANFHGARLDSAALGDAKLSKANLVWADLTQADLRSTDLSGADLSMANFSRTNLANANFVDARMRATTFCLVDLSDVKGLDTVQHVGRSSIGIDSVYMSKGKIPEVFLRGAGVPDEFITYMKSLVANPIEFYSCFISYSTKDQEFADQLYADLQNKNVRCWFAPHDAQGGKKLHEQIDEAIRVHEKVLLILSAESMKSEWVKTEIARARKREVREKKPVLFPVSLVSFEAIRDWECFDADAGKDSAREIREYLIPDFSEWKEHDKYKKAFGRLLRDLKAGKVVSGE